MSAHDSVRLVADPAAVSGRLDPLTGGHLRDVWRIALPLICTASAHAIKLFSDRAMVGWYSSTMLSASFLAGLLASVFIVAIIATSQYTGTFVAQYMGAGKRDRVGLAVWQGILFSLAGGVLLSALGLFGTPFLALSGHESMLLAGEQSYFLVMMTTAGFSIGAAATASFWTGRGKPWLPTVVTLVSLLLNVLFNWLFIFGSDGCQRLANTMFLSHMGQALNDLGAWCAAFLAPYASDDYPFWAWGLHWLANAWGGRPMGIFGAALATGLTEAMTFAIYVVLFLRKPHRRMFGTWPRRVFDRDVMKRLIRYGLPAGAQPFIDILTFLCFNFLIAEYGPEAGHAAAVAFSVNTLAFNPMLGMGTAATVLVGQAVGGRHIGLAERVVRSTRRLILTYVIAMAAIFLFFPDPIIRFFAEDRKPAATADAPAPALDGTPAEIVDAEAEAFEIPAYVAREDADAPASGDASKANEMARRFLFFIALWLIGDGFFVLYSSAIRGAGDTHFAMKMIMLMSIFLNAGPCIALHFLNVKFGLGWGPTPLWMVMIGYVMISGALFYWRYKHGAWKSMRVIEA